MSTLAHHRRARSTGDLATRDVLRQVRLGVPVAPVCDWVMLTHRSPSSSRMLDARVRSWVAPSRRTRGPSKSARPSRPRDTDPPHWFHRILGDRAGARSRSQRVPAEARRPRCWPLLVSRRDGRCDPGCGRPKAAPRHPPRLNTVSVLHRHTRPLRTPTIDRDYPGVAFSALRSPAVRDPCAIRARSCAQLGILMASSGQ